MHIKQITLHNFRSFRSCSTETHPFSARTNIIIGRNGSGKSNLLNAIQFVLLLSNKFVNLRAEERHALLHDDAAVNTISAYVEIVLDNSLGRLNVDGDEVVLRRTVGYKKDEFFLNRKRVTKQDVTQLLESAGFSKSNPYFIIQQGKVHSLCTMSDYERLVLLKEVAGTTVYDEKRADSMKQMEDNSNSLDKINEILQYIEERLVELEGEKEELSNYQKLDKSRRALEYTLYSSELRKNREQLDEIEHERNESTEVIGDLHEKARKVHDDIRSVEVKMKQSSGILRRTKHELQVLHEQFDNQVLQKSKLELEVGSLQEQIIADDDLRKSSENELKSLAQRIDDTKKQLRPIEASFTKQKKEMDGLIAQKEESTKTLQQIYSKLKRGKSMTIEERDAYLQNQISELESAVGEKVEEVGTQKTLLKSLSKDVEGLKSSIQAGKTKKTNHIQIFKQLEEKVARLKIERDELLDQRKAAEREASRMDDTVKEERENMMSLKSQRRAGIPRATQDGLEALEEIVDDLNLRSKYYGPVIENFSLVDPKFNLCVDVAAGGSLYHVIVEDDETAERLFTKLEEGKLGRVSFMALNQLAKNRMPQYPETNEVLPMMNRCIKFDVRLEPAFRQIFGRKLLAKNLESAGTWSASCDMDVYTLDGDVSYRKQAIFGGYADDRNNRITCYLNLVAAERRLADFENKSRSLTQKIHSYNSGISIKLAEIQKLDAKAANLAQVMETGVTELQSNTNKLESKTSQISNVKNSIPILEKEVLSLKAQIKEFTEELGTELHSALSEEERASVNEENDLQKELEEKLIDVKSKFEEISISKQRLETLLNNNLLKRKAELDAIIEDDGSTSFLSPARRKSRNSLLGNEAMARKRDLENTKAELERIEVSVSLTESKLNEAKSIDEKERAELLTLKGELETLKASDLQIKKAQEEADQGNDRLLNKRAICMSNRETNMRRIQELGSLPSSEMSQYSSKSNKELLKEIEKCNKSLKKYSHVNKKAYDQFVNFSEQRESLIGRKEELDVGAKKVKELIESLDRQKDEAINRTFRGVSAHFKDVFKELVPNGEGELIMRTALNDDKDDQTDNEDDDKIEEDEEDEEEEDGKSSSEQENDESDSEAPVKKKQKKTHIKKTSTKMKVKKKGKTSSNVAPAVSLYRGVGIKVRFTPLGENYMMSQLSGGQKALVAMALIFAIQRCDPAPFYIFDELDQALDSTYRAAVASLISRQANSEDNPTQFICSTFRPELVRVANRCYGISHQNKVSSILSIEKKEALEFVANLMTEEEAVQEVEKVRSNTTRNKVAVVQQQQGNDNDTADSEERGDEMEEVDEAGVVTSPEAPSPPPARRRSRRSN